MKQIAFIILLACVGAPRLAGATPITWQWSATVSGSVLGFDDPLPIRNRTPMVFTATFDSAAPNLCPPGTVGSGNYALTNATLSFLGNRRTTTGGGIESNSGLGNCAGGNETIFRTFFPGGGYSTPDGTPFDLFRAPGVFFALGAPDPATPGGLPTTLPFQPFPTFINYPGGFDVADLTFDSVHLTVVPEPGTLVLVGSGITLALWRRRRKVPIEVRTGASL